MANTYIYRTLGTPTSTSKGTVSHWIKRGAVGVNEGSYGTFGVFNNGGAAADRGHLNIYNDTIYFYNQQTSTVIQTNKKLRDVNGWYHIVIAWDTTQATASNRVKIYVNGEQETSFSTANYPGQNNTMEFNVSGRRFALGALGSNGNAAYFWDGLISHFHFCDGYTYAASDFGSTDSTTGEWEINTAPSVTYGNNGFFILKDGNSLTDQSGNSNNFTLGGGTLTFTHDNPSNLFCNLNQNTSKAKPTLSLGNLKTGSSSDGNYVFGTIGSKAGYYEIKLGQNPNGANGNGLTFGTFDSNYGDTTINTTSYRAFKTNHGYTTNYSVDDTGGGNSWEGVSTGVSAAAGDIINVAWKNGKLYVGKNGTYFFSANPSNNTDGSTQVPLEDSNAYQLPISKSNVDGMTNSEWNFGNGYFGTTAITSNSGNGYQDANGQGKFQYQPPTGCYALCTKNLNV